jgi:two-component system KDP operon response regulator KdpE
MALYPEKKRILLVYVDKVRAAGLVTLFAGDEREVVACPLSTSLNGLLEDLGPDLIILDPPRERRELVSACAALRAVTERPVLVVSEQRSEMAVTEALGAGADEYVVLPAGDRELVARANALLRRAAGHARLASETAVGGLLLDASDLSVTLRGRRITLSPTEVRLLSCLTSAPGKVITHEALMRRVWGPEYVASRHYLHLYVRYLREKLEEDPKRPQLIHSEWGVGYRLQPQTTADGRALQEPS